MKILQSPIERETLALAIQRFRSALTLVGAFTAGIVAAWPFLNWPANAPKQAASGAGARAGYSLLATGRTVVRPPHPFPGGAIWSLTLHPRGAWLISSESTFDEAYRWQAPTMGHPCGRRLLLRHPDTLAVIRELPMVAQVLAVSPDGEHLLGLDRKGWATVWETRNWTRFMRLAPGSIDSPAGFFSAGGKQIAVRTQSAGVSVWAFPRGRRLGGVPAAWGLAGLLPDGETCLVTIGDTVQAAGAGPRGRLRNVGNERAALGYAAKLAVSPCGAQVASVEMDNELLLWRTDGWHVRRKVKLAHDGYKQLAWSPDGASLVLGDRLGGVWRIDADTGSITRICAVESKSPRLAVSHQAELVAVSSGEQIYMLKRQ